MATRNMAVINPAPVAAVVLVLITLSAAFSDNRGILGNVAVAEPCGFEFPRLVVMHLEPGDDIHLNAERVSSANLGRRLEEVMRRRAEKLLFVVADGSMSFGEVLKLVDTASQYVDHLALITPQVENQTRWPTESCLDVRLR